MKIEKYHGIGNDFLITQDETLIDNHNLIKSLCNRYTGLGADGLIIVKTNPLEMVFYNQDGTRGEMCGNGIRCFSLYCYNHKLIDSEKFIVSTLDGEKIIKIESTNPFITSVKMGTFTNKCDIYNIEYNNATYKVYFINFGVPHAVIYTNDLIDDALGSYISNHKYFKNKTNVNFVQVLNKNQIKLKTYERGVGFTKACGTGSCASFIICKQLNLVDNNVLVMQELGNLEITNQQNDIIMKGPAVKIADIIL